MSKRLIRFFAVSAVSYASILIYFYFIFIPYLSRFYFERLFADYDKPYSWVYELLMILSIIAIPCIIGSSVYIILARKYEVPMRHPFIFIPYYWALFPVTLLIATNLTIDISTLDKIAVGSPESVFFAGAQFLLMTMMIYVITPNAQKSS